MNQHLAVIDLETLSHWSDAVILSCGLTVGEYTTQAPSFDDLVGKGLYVKLNVTEQVKEFGRDRDPEVVSWWMSQEGFAKQVLYPSPDDVSVKELRERIANFFWNQHIDPYKVDFYDRRSYDMSKLEHLFKKQTKQELPWNYRNEYEVSTVLRILGFDRYGGIRTDDYPQMVYHHALHDAALDHIRILHAMNSLGMIK